MIAVLTMGLSSVSVITNVLRLRATVQGSGTTPEFTKLEHESRTARLELHTSRGLA